MRVNTSQMRRPNTEGIKNQRLLQDIQFKYKKSIDFNRFSQSQNHMILARVLRIKSCFNSFVLLIYSPLKVGGTNPWFWHLQQNPVVPPTLLSLPSPHGTPPTKGPEKSHQVLPPLWTQHDLIIFTILDSPGYGSAIEYASPTIAKKLFPEGWI